MATEGGEEGQEKARADALAEDGRLGFMGTRCAEERTGKTMLKNTHSAGEQGKKEVQMQV